MCTTLLAAGQAGGGTELIDPSGAVSEAELAGLLTQLAAYRASSHVGGIALCGTTPPGAESLYEAVGQQLAAETAEDAPPTVLLLDGHKGVDALLSSGRVDVLKINAQEARALTGAATSDAAAAKLLHAEGAPLRRAGALLAITDGPQPSRLYSRSGAAFTLRVPAIECVNAIGAGDVCTAIFLHDLVAARAAAGGAAEDDAAAEAFAWALRPPARAARTRSRNSAGRRSSR